MNVIYCKIEIVRVYGNGVSYVKYMKRAIYIKKSVSFKENKHIFFYESDKKYCYMKGRTEKKDQNRKLRKVERYMKQNDLLYKDEMLEFIRKKPKHIRGDIINFIAKDQKMIRKKEYLHIIS